MSSRRTVAVLGPIPRDHITTHRGETLDKYGRVVYTAAAPSALLGPDDRVCPIVHVRRQEEEPIKELLAPFPHVDLTGIRSESDRGDLVELTYVDQNKRVERQTGFMDPILPEDVEFVRGADAFVSVPITDRLRGRPGHVGVHQATQRRRDPARRPWTNEHPDAGAVNGSTGCGSSGIPGSRTWTSSR